MFELNANKFTKLLICTLIIFVSGCSKNSDTTRLSIFDTEPKSHKPIKVNFTVRKQEIGLEKLVDDQKKQYQTIWPRIIDQFALQEYDNPRIDKEIAFLLRDPNFLTRVQERAEPYLHFIIEEVEAKQLPGEFALLPVIESAFKTHAYSHMHAAGLWQFIPSTGRIFGLHQNWEYDGRRDIYAATGAATHYLKQLSEKFEGDWLLGLASYNTGSGNVAKAIKRNQAKNLPTDYWSLKLHRETMAYVPRFLAVAKIFANPELYNVTLRPIANEPVFTVVDIGSQLDIAKAAELADMTKDELKVFNPAFNRRHSTPKNGPHRLLIPVQKAEDFKLKLAQLPADQRVAKRADDQPRRYRVKRGDSLGAIAKRHNSSVNAIRVANNMTGSRIFPGKSLVIPTGRQVHKYKSNKRVAKRRSKPKTYRVRSGDNLWTIARKFSVSTRNLMRWNKLTTKSVLKPGQKLALSSRGAKSSLRSFKYTVRKGDSLARISRKFNVSINSLRKWNTLGKYLKPGQKLKVLRPAT